MKIRFVLIWIIISGLFAAPAFAKPANFIIIFVDDQGYGDLSCFGSKAIKTPNIDRLAVEGRKFTSFMVSSPVCSPSRATLMTACYPKRVGLHRHVLTPQSTKGLNPEEYTIADHLKSLGYATACFGKWHLGHLPEVLPTANGFDTYFGIPYSNDMNHPGNKGRPKMGADGLDVQWADPESCLTKWKTPLMEDEKIIELPVDQRTVTRRYTQKAIDYIKEHKNEPFFVYLPHSMPHVPLYVPDDLYDSDEKQAYKITIEHIDSEVGRLLDTLDELKLTDNTYVIYSSDNGPAKHWKHHGGLAGPLRGGKGSTFEGGQRVPCLMRGPGIPAGTVCDELTGTIDVLPTIAAMTGKPLPGGKRIDGLDVSGLWMGTQEKSPRNEFLFYTTKGQIEGIRDGNWKLLVKQAPLSKTKNNPEQPRVPETLLYDLSKDVGEQKNMAGQHPELVSRLRARMTELDAEITKNARPTWSK